MAASVIEQEPFYKILPVGQEIIFTVSNIDAVANQQQVKFGVDVHISNSTMPSVNVSTHFIGTFKATPNNAGVGMFDLRNIIENYVSADNMCSVSNVANIGPQYKSTYASPVQNFPIHIIDKYSRNTNTVSFMVLQFYVEYLGATDASGSQDDNVVRRADGTETPSDEFTIFNGYLKYNDKLRFFQGDFGYLMQIFFPYPAFPAVNTRRFLTNAPTIQNANLEDYGTVAFLTSDEVSADKLNSIILKYYDCDGNFLDEETVIKNNVNGAYIHFITVLTAKQLTFFAPFPGNLQNWSSTFNALVTAGTIQGGSITFAGYTDDAVPFASTKTYTININCPEQKGFEAIRLTWLNQWGAWDYYTFTKKSTRTLKSKGTTYQQLGGTWNNRLYTPDAFKGGKKTFRVNAVEKIKMNTDFVSEDFNVMFEELTNSPEVYMLEGFQTDTAIPALNQYVKPVRLTTSSFTRKTRANDNLLQYTFEIEKTKTLRTQSV